MNASAILCPEEDRRAAAELWVKITAVHFTATAIFCHLLSIRGQAIFTWKLVFFVLAPWIFVLQHAIALVVILTAAVVSSALLPPPRRADHRRALGWLFGRLNAQPEHAGGPASGRIVTQASCGSVGRTLVAAAILVQCSFSVYLFTRRRGHDPESIARADRKVFELGSAGLLAGFLWMAQVAGVMPFAGPTPPLFMDQPAARRGAGPPLSDATTAAGQTTADFQDIEMELATRTPADGGLRQPDVEGGDPPRAVVADEPTDQPLGQPADHTADPEAHRQPANQGRAAANPELIVTRLDFAIWYLRDINLINPTALLGAFSVDSCIRHILVLGLLSILTRQIDLIGAGWDLWSSLLSFAGLAAGAVLLLIFFISLSTYWEQFNPPGLATSARRYRGRRGGRGGGYRAVPRSPQPPPSTVAQGPSLPPGPPRSFLSMFGEAVFEIFLKGLPVAIAWVISVLGIAAFVMSIYGFVQMLLEIGQLADWPTDQACPMLWSDPAANWVWAIA